MSDHLLSFTPWIAAAPGVAAIEGLWPTAGRRGEARRETNDHLREQTAIRNVDSPAARLVDEADEVLAGILSSSSAVTLDGFASHDFTV